MTIVQTPPAFATLDVFSLTTEQIEEMLGSESYAEWCAARAAADRQDGDERAEQAAWDGYRELYAACEEG